MRDTVAQIEKNERDFLHCRFVDIRLEETTDLDDKTIAQLAVYNDENANAHTPAEELFNQGLDRHQYEHIGIDPENPGMSHFAVL